MEESGLANNTLVRQKGGDEKKASTPNVVGKVKEWMDKNINQLTLGRGGSSIELEDPSSPLRNIQAVFGVKPLLLPDWLPWPAPLTHDYSPC